MLVPPTDPVVLVVGHVCLDLTPVLSDLPSLIPGQLQNVGPLRVEVGGCVANTGGVLASLGVRTLVGGDLGNDALADLLREALSTQGLDVSGFGTVAGTTSYSIVVQPPGADRTFWHHVGVNAAFDGAEVVFGDATLLHVGYPPLLPGLVSDDGTPLVTLLARARAAGLSTSLDMAVVDAPDTASRARWSRMLNRILPGVDVASPSLDDLTSALGAQAVSDESGSPAPLAAARDLVRRGAAIAVVSSGAAGLALATAPSTRFRDAAGPVAALPPSWHGIELRQPARSVPPVRTTGAGDAATAGLLAAITRAMEPASALAFAADVAGAQVGGLAFPTVSSLAAAGTPSA